MTSSEAAKAATAAAKAATAAADATAAATTGHGRDDGTRRRWPGKLLGAPTDAT